MNKTKLVLLSAISLATIFLFACSSDDSGDPNPNDGDGTSANTSTPSSSSKAIEYGSLNYGGQSYKTVKIGSQTWMAENLNYNAEGSKCYNNQESNCAIYGRLYDWATAMALESDCNNAICADKIDAKHQGICPGGWHIPSNDEWDVLTNYVESQYGDLTAGKHLKANSIWPYCDSESFPCYDTYGFAALPGGLCYFGGIFSSANDGYWWSSYENSANSAHSRLMSYSNNENVLRGSEFKSSLFSIRCLQD